MEWAHDPDHPLTRVCTKCGEEKHLMEFHLRYETGRRRSQCKACRCAYSRQHYAEHAERCRAKNRARYAASRERRRKRAETPTPQSRARSREAQRRYRRRHPDRAIVRQVSRGLVKLGLIEIEERCAVCGSSEYELHHPDYSDPFRVVPLCRQCHMALHWAEWKRKGNGPVKYPEEYR
jgi:hypothetical protein